MPTTTASQFTAPSDLLAIAEARLTLALARDAATNAWMHVGVAATIATSADLRAAEAALVALAGEDALRLHHSPGEAHALLNEARVVALGETAARVLELRNLIRWNAGTPFAAAYRAELAALTSSEQRAA